MALTPKQEKFAQLIASGTNQSEAYKQSYNAENMQASTIAEKASRLVRRDNIRARVEELQKPVVKKLEYTLEAHLNRMKELQQFAMQLEQPSAAIKAEENIGKVLGFYTNKTELSGPGGGPIDIQLVKKVIKK